MLKRRWLIWSALSAGCLLTGVSWALNDYVFADLYRSFKASPISLKEQMAWEIVYWVVWAALAPLIFWITRKLPIDRKRWVSSLLVHLSAGALLVVVHRAFYLFIAWLLYVAPHDPATSVFSLYRRVLFFNLPTGLMSFASILLVSYLVGYYQRFQEEELKASELKRQLAEAQLQVARAQLQALKMQLQPHFLFNTLNSISALLHEDIEAADEMLARLGDFLRMTLDNSGAERVTLQEELEFLRCYLEIERVRFQDRLTVSISVESEALEARVPNLILQPIVENAIRHGVVRRLGPGLIEVVGTRVGDRLGLRVVDNGPGMEAGAALDSRVREGLGLANTRARLEKLYALDYSFEYVNAPGGGLQVSVQIPFEVATAAEPPIASGVA
jgi:sensor histidine kinase YesM